MFMELNKFDTINGHVIPAMISKFIKLKKNKKKNITLLLFSLYYILIIWQMLF